MRRQALREFLVQLESLFPEFKANSPHNQHIFDALEKDAMTKDISLTELISLLNIITENGNRKQDIQSKDTIEKLKQELLEKEIELDRFRSLMKWRDESGARSDIEISSVPDNIMIAMSNCLCKLTLSEKGRAWKNPVFPQVVKYSLLLALLINFFRWLIDLLHMYQSLLGPYKYCKGIETSF